MIFLLLLVHANAACACAHGYCAGEACVCDEGWHGPTCAEAGDCGPHGHFQDGICVCEQGFFGPDCHDSSCAMDCRGHGVCANGLCYCEQGWTGQSCALRVADAVLSNVAAKEESAVSEELSNVAELFYRTEQKAVQKGITTSTTVAPAVPVVRPDADTHQPEAVRDASMAATDRNLALVDSLLSKLAASAASVPTPAPTKAPNVQPPALELAAPRPRPRVLSRETATPAPKNRSQLPAATPARPPALVSRAPKHSGSFVSRLRAALNRTALLQSKNAKYDQDQDDEDATVTNGSTNITVENIVHLDELAPAVKAADKSTEVWREKQRYAATAACGGCSGHGICDFDTRTCQCDSPFFGEHCTKFHKSGSSCELDCGTHGHCIADKCVCAKGWTGSMCDLEDCPESCNGQGTCIDKQCICNDLFMGATCNVRRCTGDCNGHGTCEKSHCTCDKGYIGDACDKVAPPQENTWVASAAPTVPAPLVAHTVAYVKTMPLATCPEECNQHGKCVGNTCNCYTGYTGPACDSFCPNNCFGRGECIDGGCLCVAGFVGVDCSISACCNGHGDCSIPDTCICQKGWMGGACGIAAPCFDAMCGGHGTCDGAGGCACDSGWTGSDCTTAPTECVECIHGTCNRLQGRCECEQGYEGHDCSVSPEDAAAAQQALDAAGEDGSGPPPGSVPLQDLSGSPLTEGSEAARLAREKARLRRLRRKMKKAAQEVKEEVACGAKTPKCSGHGVCNETLSVCECQDGWSGDHCDFLHCAGFNETSGVSDCHGHGECEDGECSCAPGWGTPDPKTGVALLEGITEACEARVCPSQCSIHGRCTDGECICDEGWTGNTCHRVECPNKCSGHGTCAFWAGSDSPGECECFQGYLGGDCSRAETTMRQCPNNCNGNGLCFDGRCACSDGFRGPDCGEAVCSDPQKLGPECNVERCVNDCQGQGLCFSGTCECWDGYYGDDCGVPRDCMEGCAALCQEDSRVPHCATCLGDCESMLAGDRLGKHAWTQDIHS